MSKDIAPSVLVTLHQAYSQVQRAHTATNSIERSVGIINALAKLQELFPLITKLLPGEQQDPKQETTPVPTSDNGWQLAKRLYEALQRVYPFVGYEIEDDITQARSALVAAGIIEQEDQA